MSQFPHFNPLSRQNKSHFKSANLRECVQHFTGKPLENAHSAMADVLGCMAVYFAIQDTPVAI